MTIQQSQELIDLLTAVKRLALNFDCGTAYIRRQFVDEQAVLVKRIDEVIAERKAATTTWEK
jgi:hypothetical protein